MKDLFGKALLDYQNGNYTEDLITSTSISDEDELPLSYLFRSFEEMPKLEQKALQLAKGKVLDVGCGSGSHSRALWAVWAPSMLPKPCRWRWLTPGAC